MKLCNFDFEEFLAYVKGTRLFFLHFAHWVKEALWGSFWTHCSGEICQVVIAFTIHVWAWPFNGPWRGSLVSTLMCCHNIYHHVLEILDIHRTTTWAKHKSPFGWNWCFCWKSCLYIVIFSVLPRAAHIISASLCCRAKIKDDVVFCCDGAPSMFGTSPARRRLRGMCLSDLLVFY